MRYGRTRRHCRRKALEGDKPADRPTRHTVILGRRTTLCEKPDGQQERLSFNNAVPNGTFGLQNLTPGEVVEREHSFSLNQIPKFIQEIAATYEYEG